MISERQRASPFSYHYIIVNVSLWKIGLLRDDQHASIPSKSITSFLEAVSYIADAVGA